MQRVRDERRFHLWLMSNQGKPYRDRSLQEQLTAYAYTCFGMEAVLAAHRLTLEQQAMGVEVNL